MVGSALLGAAGAGGLALATLLLSGLRRVVTPPPATLPPGFGETAQLAARLFTAYLLPFELTSVLLLVAVVGAVALAQKRG